MSVRHENGEFWGLSTPATWGVAQLHEITSELRRGRAPAYEGGTTIVLNQKCIRPGRRIDLRYAKKTNEAAKSLPGWSLLRTGDVVINSTGTGTLGRVSWISQDPGRMTFDTHVTLVRPASREINTAFLGWFLHAHEADLIELGGGSTNQKELRRADLELVLVPLPPRAEQDRIVEAIESAMAKVDEAEAGLRTALSQAEMLAAAGIDAALSGRASIGSVAQELRSAERRTLNEVADVRYGYTATSHPEPRGVPFLRITDIQNDTVKWGEVPYCDIQNSDHAKFQLETGDLVFARSGATTGKSFLVEDPPKGAVFASYLIRVRPKRELILPDYLALVFRGAEYWRYVGTKSRGMAQPNLNGTILGEMEILVPPLAAQAASVEAADAIVAEVRASKGAIEEQLEHAQALRRSILQQAFSGQLVPQDPDDEPASELLERIKEGKAEAERALKEAKKKARANGAENRSRKKTARKRKAKAAKKA